jgi:hypothetical protein
MVLSVYVIFAYGAALILQFLIITYAICVTIPVRGEVLQAIFCFAIVSVFHIILVIVFLLFVLWSLHQFL